jgi:glycosyltransferase involved in cell wall biosynthesis
MQHSNDKKQDFSLSVVVTVYNNSEHIESTLTSIAQQTYPHFEVVVVDDGSTDETPALIETFCARDPRFVLYRQKNGGASRARNYGIEQAKGDWVALCDGDDMWLEDKLAAQVAFIKEHEHRYAEPFIAVGGSQYFLNAKGTKARKFGGMGIQTAEEFLRIRQQHGSIMLPTSTLLFKKEYFYRVGGYDPEDIAANDLGFLMRLADHGIMLNMSRPLGYYRVYSGSLTDKKFTFQQINRLRIYENSRRRAHGESELSYDAYLTKLKGNPVAFKKLTRDIKVRFLYRQSSSAFLNEQYVKSFVFGAKAALNSPQFIFQKIGHQLRLPTHLLQNIINKQK